MSAPFRMKTRGFTLPTEEEKEKDYHARIELVARYMIALKKTTGTTSNNRDKSVVFNQIVYGQFGISDPLTVMELKTLAESTKCSGTKVHCKGSLSGIGEFGGAQDSAEDAIEEAFSCIFYRLGKLLAFLNHANKFIHEETSDEAIERYIQAEATQTTRLVERITKEKQKFFSIVIIDCRQFEGTASTPEEARAISFAGLKRFLKDIHAKMLELDDELDGFESCFDFDKNVVQTLDYTIALYQAQLQ